MLWNRTRCLRNKKRKKTVITTHNSSAAAPAARCVYNWLLACSDDTSIIDDRTYFYTGTKKKSHEKEKHLVLNSNLRRWGRRDSSLSIHVLRFIHVNLSDQSDYVSTRTNRRLERNGKETKKSTRRRETTRARCRPLLARSGGASKVRRVQQSAHREVDLISI